MKRSRSGWRYLWTSPDIRRKLLITLLILIIYRFAAQVAVPGVDRTALEQIFQGGGPGANLLNLINMVTGGTIRQFSIMAMGVYPYITAQIILQLLTPIIPSWQRRMEADPREGRKWMEKTTLYFSVAMAAVTAFGQIRVFSAFATVPIIPNFGFTGDKILPSTTIILVMTAGTMFAIWLGELISEHGIRNQGLSLIIFAGIISQMPNTYLQLWQNEDVRWIGIGSILVITLLTIFAIVYVQQGQRNVPVMYPGRRVGNRMSMPVKGTLPLRVNMAGMIPLIFGQAFLQFPAIIGGLFIASETEWVANLATKMQAWFGGGSDVYWVFYFLVVVGFAFFYTDVLFAQQNYGENLKRAGAQIPGVSRGAPTQRYLTRVLRRITFPGAVFLGAIAILPFLITKLIPPLSEFSRSTGGSFLINASGLLIVVGVVRDTFFNIEAELKIHGYDESLLVR
jgi:preprotein translocase subunit SecY